MTDTTSTPTPSALAAEIKRLADWLGDVRILASRRRASREEVSPAASELHDAIDRLAAMASSAQQGEPVAKWERLSPSLDKGKPYKAAVHAAQQARSELAPAIALLSRSSMADRVCQEVAELPDRCSPEDWPEAMLVTADELQAIIIAALQANDTTKGK